MTQPIASAWSPLPAGRRGSSDAHDLDRGEMTLGDGLFAYLSSTLSVGDRVYPLTLPQGAVLPAVVCQLVGGEGPLHSHTDAHDGTAPEGSSYQRSRLQLGCWADSARAAEVLAVQVERAVDAFTGTSGAVPIASALVELSLDDSRPDFRRSRRIVDVLVQWGGGSHGP
jgi:hypothetical protein